MPSTLLPAAIGIAPEFALPLPLAALGPIILASTCLTVLLLAVRITRSA
jgi:hypothetical protein